MADANPAATDLTFGMASITEVEAILVTAVVAALLAGWGVVTQRIVTRRAKTIEHIGQQTADEDMIKARKCFNTLSQPDGKLSTYVKPADLSDVETTQVRLVLNDYELKAIAVQSGIFDLAILKKFERGTTIRDWDRAASFIHKLRLEIDNPFIYYEFESLATWMRERKMPNRRIWTKLFF